MAVVRVASRGKPQLLELPGRPAGQEQRARLPAYEQRHEEAVVAQGDAVAHHLRSAQTASAANQRTPNAVGLRRRVLWFSLEQRQRLVMMLKASH